MKTLKAALSFILTVIVVSSMFMQSVEAEISPMYVHTSKLIASLSIVDGKANVLGYIKPVKDAHAAITVRLQTKSEGQWKTVQTWTKSSKSGGVRVSETKTITKNNEYRVYAIAYIYDSSEKVAETLYKYSDVKKN